MYAYTWDIETGGLLLNSTHLAFSKEPRPVYSSELDLLGFDKIWTYDKDDSKPYLWAEANNYIYRGTLVAQLKGGSLYHAPEIKLIAEPEPNGGKLRFVDIDRMVEKNAEIIEALSKETIRKIYQVFVEYKQKTDIFHVSFSGGKDSEVALDLVQKSLPHDKFIVIFGDTGMEFPDTYQAIEIAKERCKKQNIKFYVASSHFDPKDSWQKFGPPASAIRWCCSVHKTTPQLLLLRSLLNKNNFTEMAFVGVRRDESLRRSEYDFISYGTKHKGQWSCNPILEWNSAEVYLYIYKNALYLNTAYKKGLSRAGCLVCPMAKNKSDYIDRTCFNETETFLDIIKKMNASDKGNEIKQISYLENNGWKARKNGRDLTIAEKDYNEEIKNDQLVIKFKDYLDAWKDWMYVVGKTIPTKIENEYCIDHNDKEFVFSVCNIGENYFQASISLKQYRNNFQFVKLFRRVFRKTHYCVACKVCEANCKYGNLKFEKNGKPIISRNCIHCGQCFDIDTGCLRYKSIWISKGNGVMENKSLDSYANHAPKLEWFNQFIKLGNDFDTKNTMGTNEIPMFKKFLRHAGILIKNQDTKIGTLLRQKGLQNEETWGLMYTNLCYSPQINWYIKNSDIGERFTQRHIESLLSDIMGISKSAIKSIPNSIKRISLLPLNKLGFGCCVDSSRENGFVLCRTPWNNPSPLVILYSLYKYAEACDNYYQFSLSQLYDNTIESKGVSPATIFGIDKDTMVKILNGLSINHNDFISVSFTIDLENITLRNDKTSDDVLNLF